MSSHNSTPGQVTPAVIRLRPSSDSFWLRALIEGANLRFGHGHRPFPIGGRIAGQEHAPFAPIEHVDDSHHVTLACQFGGDALAAVAPLLECGQHRVLAVVLDDLFLAPEIHPVVAVQRENARRREFGLLGNQHADGNAQVGRRPERQVLLDVVAPVGATDQLRLGSDCVAERKTGARTPWPARPAATASGS